MGFIAHLERNVMGPCCQGYQAVSTQTTRVRTYKDCANNLKQRLCSLFKRYVPGRAAYCAQKKDARFAKTVQR